MWVFYAIFQCFLCWLGLFITGLCLRHIETLKIAFATANRDIKGLWLFLRIEAFMYLNYRRNTTIPQLFDKICKKYGDKTAVIHVDSGKSFTFRQMNDYTNQTANLFARIGYKQGDVVAIFMLNCPEFLWLWLGISKLGIPVALINTNLRLESLAHSVNVVAAKAVICDKHLAKVSDLIEAVNKNLIDRKIEIFVFDEDVENYRPYGGHNIFALIQTQDTKLDRINIKPNIKFRDTLLYLYTSGTTGFPKAAIISHARFMLATTGAQLAFGLYSTDRVYTTLPLYHGSGGVLASGQMVTNGATAVIRSKFSASNFWDDVVKHKCTVSHYIGEICRYLLAQPNKYSEKQHSIRVMFGNGLRPEIWDDFVTRFNIGKIGEFYASTEGNNSLVNLTNRKGSCGFFPIYEVLRKLYPVVLIKVDEDTLVPIRTADGLCIPCKPGDSGEVVGKIIMGNPVKEFKGYLSESETQKKIIRDVFQKGDSAFSSGDLLRMDQFGYLYFKDRTGDTFRWKGENVSTLQVEIVISKILQLTDVIVYGVEIPGTDGKAGMTAIATEPQNVDFNYLYAQLILNLPGYAIPLFIRFVEHIDKTGTQKMQKSKFRADGYTICSDPIFYLSTAEKTFKRLDNPILKHIAEGKFKF